MTETIAYSPAMSRHVTVELSMCGQNALLAARIGDWTWETVSHQTKFDVLSAHTPYGERTYLVYSYFHIQAGALLHPLGLSIGNELDVHSQAFDSGGGTVSVLHRIAPTDIASATPTEPLDPAEPETWPQSERMYVRTINNWVRRGRDGNPTLATATPDGFTTAPLPALPDGRRFRAVLSHARRTSSLAGLLQPSLQPIGAEHTTYYRIDPSRDLNAAGIVYFAAYFSFIDSALLALWRRDGGSDAGFLNRRVLDQKICYYANATPDTTLAITIRLLKDPARSREEVADVLIRDRADGRLLAVSVIRLAARRVP